MRWIAFIFLGFFAVAAGCDSSDPVVCTLQLVPSFRVTVLDSISAEPVMDPVVWVRDNRFVDTLLVSGNEAWAPWERAGVYEVMAGKAGYLTWKQDGVRVTKDRCHVQTVRLDALLQRPPG